MTWRSSVHGRFIPLLVAAAAAASQAIRADIISSGDISPVNPPSWTTSTNAIVGNTASGNVAIKLGSALNSGNTTLGNAVGSTGIVDVNGIGSIWTYGGSLFIGKSGVGSLTIENGGIVSGGSATLSSNPGASGHVAVAGSGSTWSIVGALAIGGNAGGNAILTVSDGGHVNAGPIYLGEYPGSQGILVVSGSGSRVSSSDAMFVGRGSDTSSVGTLTINTGGGVSGTAFVVSSGTVGVDGLGTSWTASQAIDIGTYATTVLNVTNGGYVNSPAVSFGVGTINVDGTGSQLASGVQLTTGGSGLLNINVTRGGVIQSSITSLGSNYAGSNSSQVVVNAAVDGPGSIWNVSGFFEIGSGGGSSLAITNGGQVHNFSGSKVTIGYYNDAYGVVNISGAGSVWNTDGTFCIGDAGKGTLTIVGGGYLNCTNAGSFSIGSQSGSSGVANIVGTGSTLASSAPIYVGNSGIGSLNLSGGAIINCSSNSYLGYNNGGTGTATVDGSGSTWNNNGAIYVGYSGKGTLNITNGGQVSTPGIVYVSTNGSTTGAINFGSSGGTLSCLALYAVRSQLTGVGTINSHGLIGDFDLVVDATHGPIQTLMLNGSNQNITVNLNLTGAGGVLAELGIGYSGNGSLAVRDGQQISTANGYVGYMGGSSGIAAVDGPGSTWTSSGTLYVGNSGIGKLTITHGGIVSSSSSSYLGYNYIATGNVKVDGPGATWNTGGPLYIGYSGNGTVNVTNGGMANNSSSSYLGYNYNSTGNVTVDGLGSTWNTGGPIYIGYSGNGTLNISNGGQAATTGIVFVGTVSSTTAVINFVSIGGTLNCLSLYASPSQLLGVGTINSHGLVTDFNLVVDATHSSAQTVLLSNSNQNITVNLDLTGAGGVLGDLGIGYRGNGSLAVRDGRQIFTASGYLAYLPGSTGIASVDGPGSTWTCGGDLYIGKSGNGTLNITNGGQVTAAGATYVTYGGGTVGTVNFGADGGTLIAHTFYGAPEQITGTGVVNTCGFIDDGNLVFDATHGLAQTINWSGANQNVTVNFDLTGASGAVNTFGVGNRGAGTLIVQDGMKITDINGYLGYGTGGSGLATVSGSGSTWANTSSLYVARAGSATLNIANAGTVTDGLGIIGFSGNSTGTVNVNGPSSNWSNGQLYVGYLSSGILNITNGGNVSTYDVFIGGNNQFFQGGSGTVTVSGIGSTLITNGSLYVGNGGAGMLTISGDGNVSDQFSYIGGQDSYFKSAVGSVTVDGPGSMWTTKYYLTITSGTMNITGGAYVSDLTGNCSGSVKVDGPGSTWANSNSLTYSSGTLSITNGGAVSDSSASLGSAGFTPVPVTARINGSGSTWTSSAGLSFAATGNMTLSITTGGAVTNGNASFSGSGLSLPTAMVTINGSGSIWTTNGNLTFNNLSGAALSITSGGTFIDASCSMGSQFTQTGAATMTIDGPGSTWLSSGNLTVAASGNSSLSITSGGAVSDGSASFGGSSQLAGAMGVTVNGSGSSWTNKGNVSFNDLSSTLSITNGGVVNAGSCTIGGGSVTINGLGSKWASTGSFTVSNVAMSINHGGQLTSMSASIANSGVLVDGPGSMWNCCSLVLGSSILNITNGASVSDGSGSLNSATVTVNGIGSTWTNGSDCYLGYNDSSNGTLSVTNGGQVNNSSSCYIGSGSLSSGTFRVSCGGRVYNSLYTDVGSGRSSKGFLIVDGTGSSWWNNAPIFVGSQGIGTVNITNGAIMTTGGVSISSGSLLAINVGDGSLLTVNSAGLLNNGTLRLIAIPGLSPGTYSPITANSWSGAGAIQALGGSWNTATHTFLVATPTSGTASQPVTINLHQTQRIFITDPILGESVEADFQATTSNSNLTFTATSLTQAQLSLLQSQLPHGDPELAGWTFATTGYTAGNPVFLSLDVGPGYSTDELAVWHYNGSTWSAYTPSDLYYDGTYANFTVTGFSGYAVSSVVPVPEPGALMLMALGGTSFLVQRRRSVSRLHKSLSN